MGNGTHMVGRANEDTLSFSIPDPAVELHALLSLHDGGDSFYLC